ncbi:vacuolar protein sorting-associated protein 32 homolog 1-like [Tasmannia lanceolata]|uniref:vacuolar protein sorting-associated protein 32 homolog 1-like n=1 Tax=Tasmannia lanceolata TaxID=3420 RepID=UPI0040633255
MFKKLFNKPQKIPSALSTFDKLHETLEMLEKKEHVLQKKVAVEIQRAKDFTRSKHKRAAIQCLKRKKLYEAQIEQIGNFQLRVHNQIVMLEGVKATTETVDALRTAASAMKTINLSINVDDIDKTMEEMNEHNESMKHMQEVLAGPIGATADIDEDELEAELEELEEEELGGQLLQPPNREPALPPPIASHPRREKPQATSDADELAELQSEMAL